MSTGISKNDSTLSSEDKKKVLDVKEAYNSFWDHIKFKRGWAKPLFSKEEVDDLLTEAAEIVVKIRNELDKQNPCFKLRMLEGNVREYLWTQVRHPKKNPRKFVRDIVHATFQDANGYVERLTAGKIDEFIEKFEKVKLDRSELKRKWEETNSKLSSYLFDDKFQDSDKYQNLYKQIASAISSVDLALDEIESIQNNSVVEDSDPEDIRSESEPKIFQSGPKISEPEPKSEPETEPKSEPETEPKSEPKSEPDTEPKSEPKSESETEPEKPQVNLVIQRVSDEIGAIKTSIKSLAQASEQLNLEDLSKDSHYAQKVIKDLNQKCLTYTEELMKDLLNLDQVVCSQEERPLRKAQVNNIQGLLGDVDAIKHKLTSIQTELQNKEKEKQLEKRKQEDEVRKQKEIEQKEQEEKRKLEEEEDKKKSEDEKRKQEELMRKKIEEKRRLEEEFKKKVVEERKREEENILQIEEDRKKQREDHIHKTMWKSMKFEPEFKVNNLSDKYVLSAAIPNMSEDDIKIALGKDTITISGYREPTPMELQQMRSQLAAERRRDIHGKYFPPNEDESKHLLRLGAGRFGQFSETYQIDSDTVDVNSIQASYQRGVLQVVIPKYRRNQYLRQPQSPNYGGQRSPRNFFQDNDFFW